jgi:SAM-dependent methyltransferase
MVKMSISRVSRSKDAARRNYDSLALWYDWLAGSEKRYRDIGLELLAAQKGESALEIGPGTGGGILALAVSVGGRGHVFGLDLSQRMLAQTRTRVEKSGLGARISLTCGDGASLPVKSASVDLLLMSFTVELFDTPKSRGFWPNASGFCVRMGGCVSCRFRASLPDGRCDCTSGATNTGRAPSIAVRFMCSRRWNRPVLR